MKGYPEWIPRPVSIIGLCVLGYVVGRLLRVYNLIPEFKIRIGSSNSQSVEPEVIAFMLIFGIVVIFSCTVLMLVYMLLSRIRDLEYMLAKADSLEDDEDV